jgi:hypothetical protein
MHANSILLAALKPGNILLEANSSEGGSTLNAAGSSQLVNFDSGTSILAPGHQVGPSLRRNSMIPLMSIGGMRPDLQGLACMLQISLQCFNR